MTLLSSTALRPGLFPSYFLMTLLALLIFLYLTNTGILGVMRLNTLSFLKVRTLLRAELGTGHWKMTQ
jgi:hypothetical protein